MNSLTSLPNEILFQCVTGSANYTNHQLIKNLILSGTQVKSTCKDLHIKIEKCWKTCLDALWHEWKICHSLHHSKEQFVKQLSSSPSLLLNWVDGKPKISWQSLYATLKDGFFLEINPEAEDSLLKMISTCGDDSIPTLWTSMAGKNAVAFTRSTPFGDASIIDLKARKFIGELLGHADRKLIFDQEIKPIFYKNEVIILFKLGHKLTEIAYYEIETKEISLKKSFRISQHISSMDLFNDHLVLQAHDESWSLTTNIMVLSLVDIKFVPPTHTIWTSPFRLEVFKDRILMFRYFENLAFHTLCIEEGKLKFNCLKVDKNNYIKTSSTQTLYYNNSYAFYISYTGKDYSIGAIPLSELNTPDAGLSHFNSVHRGGFAKLFQFKDSVILCSGKMGEPLEFHHVDAKNGKIKMITLSIRGTQNYKFNRIDYVYTHLDKLFIIGVLAKDEISIPSNYLVIVNMETNSFESKHLLNLDIHPTLIATDLGRLYIFNPDKKNIIQIKY